jgi:hypothetical protein
MEGGAAWKTGGGQSWRDALVKELRAYKATADHCLSVVLDRRRDEARCLRMMKGAKTHHKARAHRAWRRNAERMARKWARSLWAGRGAPPFLSLNLY